MTILLYTATSYYPLLLFPSWPVVVPGTAKHLEGGTLQVWEPGTGSPGHFLEAEALWSEGLGLGV